MTLAHALGAAGGLLAFAGAALLRLSWLRRRTTARRPILLAGWAILAGALALWTLALGGENGSAWFLTVFALAALALVAATLERKSARARRADVDDGDIALEPSLRGARLWRGALRIALAGPLSGAAAIGLGLAIAVKAPIAEADRLILGGAVVVLAWAGGMAWTLMDNRIVRAALVLILTAAAGFGASAV